MHRGAQVQPAQGTSPRKGRGAATNGFAAREHTSAGSGKFMLTKPLLVVRIQVLCYPGLDGRVHTSLYYNKACVLAEDLGGSLTVAHLCQMTLCQRRALDFK